MEKKQQELFERAPPPWEMDDAEPVLVARVYLTVPPFGPLDYGAPARWSIAWSLACESRSRWDAAREWCEGIAASSLRRDRSPPTSISAA